MWRLAAGALMAALVAAAIAGGGRLAAASDAGQRSLSSSPVQPHLTPVESKYYSIAWRATVARDRACSGFAGPTFTTGSPSRALTSRFGILRRPATPAPLLPTLLHHNLRPQHITNGWTLYNQELYLNQIRVARSAFGVSFYVIPAGNVTWEREVPARCGPEQVAALKLWVGDLPPRERARIVTAQARYLAYVRYLTLHSEGICASYYPSHIRTLDLARNLPTCATLAQLHNWGVLIEDNPQLDRAAVFWTVVPDDVAELTLRFAPSGKALKHSATRTVRPVNNVVVVSEPYRAPVKCGGYPFPSEIVLRAADGRVIKNIANTPDTSTQSRCC